jgi:predicted kinase
MTLPTLIVVSGPAGSGKTRLAHELAELIGCPAICRDEIKEGMVHASAVPFVAEPGDALTQRTLVVFFSTLHLLLRGGVTVVAEAAFQDQVWRSNLEALSDLAQIRIVQCWVDPATARQRTADRQFRAAHADRSVTADDHYFDNFVRLSLPVPAIDVDTTDGYQPPLDQLVASLNAEW